MKLVRGCLSFPVTCLTRKRLGWTTCRSQIENLQIQLSDAEIRSAIVEQPWMESGILMIGLALTLWPSLSRTVGFGR